jgi:hypothetical protein
LVTQLKKQAEKPTPKSESSMDSQETEDLVNCLKENTKNHKKKPTKKVAHFEEHSGTGRAHQISKDPQGLAGALKKDAGHGA